MSANQELYRDLECPHVGNCSNFDKHVIDGTLGIAPCEDPTKYIVHEKVCYEPKKQN